MLRPLLRKVYPDLVLSDLRQPDGLDADEPFRAADLDQSAQVEAAVDGMEGILHLGGFSVEGPWDTILQANIVGCYNLFEAARKKGVKRVVFASSNHAMGFYPRHSHIGVAAIPRPDSRYGVSKVFGEAVGALYADKHGLGVLSIRIGNVGEKPIDKRRLAIWLHPEDLVQLMRIGLEHPDLALRGRLWRLGQRADLVGQHARLSARLPAEAPRRGSCRVRTGRAGQARPRPDRRPLPGRRVLLGRVHVPAKPDRRRWHEPR